MNEIKEYTEKMFDEIKHVDENGNEYWFARELMPVLEYKLWQNFHRIIKHAIVNCKNSNYNVLDHFIDVNKMVQVGSKTTRKIKKFLKLLQRGNDYTKDETALVVKDCYDNSEFDMGDVVRISKGTTKQDELFDYVDAPDYYKERVRNYDEDEYDKDDFDLSR